MKRRKQSNRIMRVVAAALLLSACTSMTTKKPPRNAPSDDATIQLSESAHAVSDSLSELAEIEAATLPPQNKALPQPFDYSLQTRASLDWSGPIEPLVAKIAAAAHYQIRVLGHEPAVPVLISIAAEEKTLGEILRDADFQAGEKAHIVVYSPQKIIELRYAKV